LRGPNLRIYFKDETIGLNGVRWFNEFAQEVKDRNLVFTWHGNTRVSTITPEILKPMKESGCICMSFGIESGSQKIIDLYRKTTKVDQAEKAFKLCHKFGIEPTANIILGHPEETLEDLEMTYKLLKKIKPDDIAVYYLTAFPEKYIYQYAVERGLLKKNIDWVEYDTAGNREHDNCNMELLHVTIEDLKRYKKKILRYRSMRKFAPTNVAKWLLEAASEPSTAFIKAKNVARSFLKPTSTFKRDQGEEPEAYLKKHCN